MVDINGLWCKICYIGLYWHSKAFQMKSYMVDVNVSAIRQTQTVSASFQYFIHCQFVFGKLPLLMIFIDWDTKYTWIHTSDDRH